MKRVAQKIDAPNLWESNLKHFHSVLTDPWYRLIFQLSSKFLTATHKFFQEEGFDPVPMPVTVGSVSSPTGKGSDSIPVLIQLFDENIYLADSMQFQLEYLLRLADKGVYYVMPTFRGEDSSSRHLNQFFHSEVEIKGGFEDAIKLAQRYIISITSDIVESLGAQLESQNVEVKEILKTVKAFDNFPVITYDESIELLGTDEQFYRRVDADTLRITEKGERELIRKMGGICWLIYHPSNITPFYQARSDNQKYAICADLLCGIGEILGLGERQMTRKGVEQCLVSHGIEIESYAWYLRMKQDFPLKTSGFGLGMERYLLWITGHDEIRDIPLIQRLKTLKNEP